MPKKCLRIGNTENWLLFIYWLNTFKKIDTIQIQNTKHTMIEWLYTTSGYYDKTIQADYFNAKHSENDPQAYIEYMETFLDFFKNCDNSAICFWKIHINQNLRDFFDEFITFLAPKKQNYHSESIFADFADNERILLISPFAPLMKSQWESGNAKKIHDYFPNIKSMEIYRNMYTFFNQGPHQNILETINFLFDDIQKKISPENYDSVIISAGAYSVLLAKKFYDQNKNVMTMGGDLQTMFGITSGRHQDWCKKEGFQLNEYWIQKIPSEYKPENYEKIENGCYW